MKEKIKKKQIHTSPHNTPPRTKGLVRPSQAQQGPSPQHLQKMKQSKQPKKLAFLSIKIAISSK